MKHYTIALSSGASPCGSASLTCYVPDPSEKIRRSKHPAVLICPGGAYYFTNDREAEPIAFAYLAKGCACFVLRYSCRPASYPEGIREVALAMEYLTSHAEELHLDPDALVLCGFSAGGHLAANYAVRWNQPDFFDRWGGSSGTAVLPRPAALILGYPVITAGPDAHALSIENLTGKNPEAIAEVSLENQVTEAMVPTYLWHTAADEMVPVQNSLLFASALAKNNIPFELHIYPEGAHGLSLCDERTAEFDRHRNLYCRSWFEESWKFLEKYLPPGCFQ